MKKLNTTYLDNLVSKILKETLEEKADSLVSKIKGDVCECGGTMYEGECNECGYRNGEMEEDIHDFQDLNKDNEFDYVGESEDFEDDFENDEENTDEDREKTCRYHIENFGKEDPVTKEMCQGVNITESLKGRQRRLDKNKNNKIDAEDFKMLRQSKKSETDEGNAFTGALSQARKSGEKDFEVDGKKFETKEGKNFIQKAEKEIEKKGTKGDFSKHCGGEVTKSCIEKALKSGDPKLVKQANFAKNIKAYKGADHKKKIKESYRLTESEMVSLIEKIVLEQKNKEVKDPAEKNNIKGMGGSPRGLEVYKKAHNGSGKENDEYLKSVATKMKDYLKDGSKGEYDMNPKMFPKGNGELEKMSKKAYVMSKDGQDFIDDFMSPGMENLDYDQIEPNEEQITANIEGSSKTGNDSSYANAVETDVNKKINKKRKENRFAKARNMAYQKAPQPIRDATGEDSGKGINIKLESISDKKQIQINEEFERMKSLIGYNQKTQ
jgi:hypothetical protein